jgi:hypothetical protein
MIESVRANSRLSNLPTQNMKPLIRLRVDHSECDAFRKPSIRRFGQRFAADVANPSEILLFTKKRAATAHDRAPTDSVDEPQQQVASMESILRDILTADQSQFSVLTSHELGEVQHYRKFLALILCKISHRLMFLMFFGDFVVSARL